MVKQKPTNTEAEKMLSSAMDNMMEEREELMVSPTGGKPTLRTAHFLKPMMGDLSSVSLPSNFITPEFKEIPCKVQFVGRKFPLKGWKDWVDRLKPSYQDIWKKAGIFEAILCSTYQILKDDELVLNLAEKWCVDTNTFVFPWGEATITLEDMMVMGGYSVLGDSVLSPLGDKHLIDIQNELSKAHGVITQNNGQYATHYAWMNHFMGAGHCLEHEAFLVLWLSRYVFPSKYHYAVKTLFPIAIKLSKGISLALAPAVLGSIYRDLRLLKQTALAKLDASQYKESKLLLAAPLQFVQLWAWERFLTLRPEPKPINCGGPRLARWHQLSKWKVENVEEVIDAAGECIFQWRPYCTKLINWDFKFTNFYRDIPGYVLVDPDMETEVESMIRCLRVSELVGLGCIEQYLPHRVALQFGYDQDLPVSVSRSNETPDVAWSNYIRPVKDEALYTPGRLSEGDVTTRYLEWWDQLKSEKGTAADVKMSGIPSNLHRLNEGDYIDDDEEVTIVDALNVKKDNLKSAEALALDEDNITIAELLNLKKVRRSQERLAIEDLEPLPTAKRLLFSADATDVIKSGQRSVGSETEEKLETAMNEANSVEAREKVSFDNNENTIQKCEDCEINGVVKSASELGEMNEQNGVLERPSETKDRMMELEHRIRNLEKIIADTEVGKIVHSPKKPL